jgi:hypothetical protein
MAFSTNSKALDLAGTRVFWAGHEEKKAANEAVGNTSQLHLAEYLSRVYRAGKDGVNAAELGAEVRAFVLANGSEKDQQRVLKMTDAKHLGWVFKKWSSVLRVETTAAVVTPESVISEEPTDEEVAAAAV